MKNQSVLIGAGLVLALTFATTAVAQQHCSGPQIGTWKLKSYVQFDMKTGQRTAVFGAHPTGYITYGSDCRMQAIIVAEGRKAPPTIVLTDTDRIGLYKGFIAYAGAYSINGDVVSHHIDASWNETWTGTNQKRAFKIDGKTLGIKTIGLISPVTGKEVVSELV